MQMKFLSLALLIFLGLSSGLWAQRTPINLQDLIREDARFAANTMAERGYVNVGGANSSRGVYTYWWHPEEKECVSVLTKNGQYVDIAGTSPIDCNQNVHAHADEHKNKGVGIALGAAAAAIVGAAILSNKSHHHEDNQHYDDHEAEAAFEQGYRDGKYHRSYHNVFRDDKSSQAYSKGYEAGVDERQHETTYHSNRGGYRAHFNLEGLKGLQKYDVHQELKGRGFVMTDENAASQDDYYEWWQNNDTRQCYMLHFYNAYLREIDEVSSCY